MEQQSKYPNISPELRLWINGGDPAAFNPPRVINIINDASTVFIEKNRPMATGFDAEKLLAEVMPMKLCKNPDCKFGCEPQPITSFHKGAAICKDCKRIYDAKYKSERRVVEAQKAKALTKPGGNIFLYRLPNSELYKIYTKQEVDEKILNGSISNGDIIIECNIKSRQKLSFTWEDVK